jgi:hypothetical protein
MGTFGLTEFSADAAAGGAKPAALKFVKGHGGSETAPETAVHPNFNEKQPIRRVLGPAAYAIDGKDDTAWASDLGPGRHNFESTIVFALEKPVTNEGETQYAIRLKQNHGGWNSDDLQGNNLGKFRLSYTTSPDPEADPIPPHVREILSVPREQRSPAQVAALFSAWRATVPEWKRRMLKSKSCGRSIRGNDTVDPRCSRGGPADQRLEARRLAEAGQSGQPRRSRDLESARPDAPPTRLTFAKWITDNKAPTTARAFVNRVWQTYFGTGFVATSEDLGTQSEAPSHPELLDWLACEFMQPSAGAADGAKDDAKPWSIKHCIASS